MPYLTLSSRGDAPAISLHYRISGATDAACTLVLVHELGGTLRSFAELTPLLPPEIRVIAFDQRGAGQSEHPTEPFTVDDLAGDIIRLLDELEIRSPVHLLGMAMGAVVALKAAVLARSRVASLVLCDGTSEIAPDAREYILERAATVRAHGIRPVAEASFTNAFRGLANASEDPRWFDYRHRFLGNARVSYAFHSEALANVDFPLAELSAVACPALVLTGRHDFIWPPSVGQRLAARLANARFEEIEAASHFPAVQTPQQVAERVLPFIRHLMA
jgi:3-oxoadipate enol-lactonase